MSQFTPTFGPSGASGSEGAVPSPGSVAGSSRFLREDAVWAIPQAGPPGPPAPPPGPDLDQWACNAAGFIIYTCCYRLVKSVMDSNFFTLATNAIIAFAFDALAEILVPLEILDHAFINWLESTLAPYILGAVTTFEAHLLDQVLWSKFHCFLYNEIRTAGTLTNTVLLAAGTALAASGIAPTQVTQGVALILQQFGIMSVGPVPLSAFVENYDCSTCAMSGTSSAPIPIQPNYDLRVTDGTTIVPFVDTIQFNHATVSGTGKTATVTPELATLHNTVPVGVEPAIDFIDSLSVDWTLTDNPGAQEMQVSATVPTATSSAKGISRPNNANIGIDGSGILAVLDGQLAYASLSQQGSVSAGASGGTSIASLTVGKTYCVQSTGGPWTYNVGAGLTAYDWDMSVDGGATWQSVFTDGRATPGPVVNKPVWAISAAQTDANHARVTWVATGTSVLFRCGDNIFTDNSGSLGWQLLELQYEGVAPQVAHNGTKVGIRPILDFEDSATVTGTITDDPTNDRVTISLAATSAIGDPVTPLHGGTGLDTSGVTVGQLLVGSAFGGWLLGNIAPGVGISVSESGGVITISASGSGAGGTGYSLLGTAEVTGSTAANITFAVPSGSYSHLDCFFQARGDAAVTAVEARLQLNGDTGNNYNYQAVYGSGPTATALEAQGANHIEMGLVGANSSPAGYAGLLRFIVPNYLGTTWTKDVLSSNGLSRDNAATDGYSVQFYGKWRNTAAVTSITLIPSSGNWLQHSKLWVYATA